MFLSTEVNSYIYRSCFNDIFQLCLSNAHYVLYSGNGADKYFLFNFSTLVFGWDQSIQRKLKSINFCFYNLTRGHCNVLSICLPDYVRPVSIGDEAWMCRIMLASWLNVCYTKAAEITQYLMETFLLQPPWVTVQRPTTTYKNKKGYWIKNCDSGCLVPIRTLWPLGHTWSESSNELSENLTFKPET